MQIQIKNYSDEYLEGLINLVNQWDMDVEYTAQSMREHIEYINQKTDSELILAIDQSNAVLGYIFAAPCYFLCFNPFLEVLEFIIDENNRGRRIGGKLLSAIEEIAREKGFSQVHLNSRIDRERAHNFYSKMGYNFYKQAKFFKKEL